MNTDLAEAVKEAQEALEQHDIAVAGDEWSFAPISLTVADALRSLLAATEPVSKPNSECRDCHGVGFYGLADKDGDVDTVICRCGKPAPALPEEVREAAERTDKAMRDVFGGADQFGDYCGHPIMPAKLAHAVQDLLAALAGGGK